MRKFLSGCVGVLSLSNGHFRDLNFRPDIAPSLGTIIDPAFVRYIEPRGHLVFMACLGSLV